MRNLKLDDKKIKELKRDRNNGMTIKGIMDKYGVKKTSVYKYLNNVNTDNDNKLPPVRETPENSDNEEVDEKILNTPNFSDDEIHEDEPLTDNEEFDPSYITKMMLHGKDIINDEPKDHTKNKREKKEVKESEPPKNKEVVKAVKSAIRSQNKTTKTKIQETPEDEEEKEAIINKIVNYTEQFREKLEGYIPIKGLQHAKYVTGLTKKNKEQLQKELEYIRRKICHVNTKGAFKMAFNFGSNTLESMAPYVGLNLNGLTDELNNNDEIDNILKELSCEYSFNKYMDPRFRLIAHTGFTILKVDSLNKRRDEITKKAEGFRDSLEEETDEEITEKYRDI